MLEKKLETFLMDRLKASTTISAADQFRVFDEKRRSGKRFLDLLPSLSLGFQTELLKLMSEFYEIPFVDLDAHAAPDPELLKAIPEKLIRHFKALPIDRTADTVTVAVADPTDVVVVDRLGQYAKCEIIPAFASPEALDRAIDRALGPLDTLGQAIKGAGGTQAKGVGGDRASGVKPAPVSTAMSVDQAPSTAQTVEVVNTIIEKAVETRASDIHLEPTADAFRVRYRVDGVLYDYESPPPKSMEASVISRLKIMANLDIAERRLPQDGRIPYHTKDKEVNLRISTFPTIYGENVVIRVLDMGGSVLTLEQIGLIPDLEKKFERLVHQAYGMILVTGPTGSGKTTTLYAALGKVNSVERHIITLEDPVEYRMERVRQSQVDPKSGLTFARGLRSIMRQDPDVIMVGEIRDLETAQIAIQAALTGHFVFSTLHTNDAAAAMTRLMDMGVEPFLISSSVLCVVAQRLVRQLCTSCRKPYQPDGALLKRLKLDELLPSEKLSKVTFYDHAGCGRCKQTGYQGRAGIFEVLVPNDEMRRMIVRKDSAEAIRKVAIQQGMKTLQQDGLLKAFHGFTTLDEVFRVTQE